MFAPDWCVIHDWLIPYIHFLFAQCHLVPLSSNVSPYFWCLSFVFMIYFIFSVMILVLLLWVSHIQFVLLFHGVMLSAKGIYLAVDRWDGGRVICCGFWVSITELWDKCAEEEERIPAMCDVWGLFFFVLATSTHLGSFLILLWFSLGRCYNNRLFISLSVPAWHGLPL